LKLSDRILQNWRIRMAAGWIPQGAAVLDIGCFQGELFEFLGSRISRGVGLDPLAVARQTGTYELIPLPFTDPLPYGSASFDAVVMLASLEHIVDKPPLAKECFRLLRPGGRVIVTVPAPLVDRIVDLLVRLRLVDGMSLEQHHGFLPESVPSVFLPFGFRLEKHRRFQLGLNHLFVFRKDG
jgi:SAM-dependent methyltransferase